MIRTCARGILVLVVLSIATAPSATAHGEGHDKLDSGLMATEGSYAYTFLAAGIYDYGCITHEGMLGAVYVDPDAERGGDIDLVVHGHAYKERDGDGFVDADALHVRPGTTITWTVLDDTNETGAHSVTLSHFTETGPENEEAGGLSLGLLVGVLGALGWVVHAGRRRV